MFKAIVELCDVVSLAAYCAEDASLMLTLESTTNEYWIPSGKIVPNENVSWLEQSVNDFQEIFGKVPVEPKVLQMYKVWMPDHTTPYICHCVYGVQVNGELKKKAKATVGKYRGKVRWVQEPELISLLKQQQLRTPELIHFFNLSRGGQAHMLKDGGKTQLAIEPYGLLAEITENILVEVDKKTNYGQMLESASCTSDLQTALYREFVFICFPATYMSSQAFIRLGLQLGWSRDDAPFIFKAADMNNRWGLSFRDVLYVIAAMEPTTSHGGGPAEIRCRYIFRFFDRDQDNVLNDVEFKTFVTAIRVSKKQTIDAKSVNAEADLCLKNLNLPSAGNLSIADFLRAVGDLKLRGTSQIFRSPTSVSQYLRKLQ